MTGIGQYTINLFKALSKIDKKNTYILAVPEKVKFNFGANFHIKIIPFIKFGSLGFKKVFFEQIGLPKFFRNQKVDLIHSLYPSNSFIFAKPKTIVTVHDTIPWELAQYRHGFFSEIYHYVTLKSLKKAKNIICVSKITKKHLQKILKKSPKINIIYNSCSNEFFKKISREQKIQIQKKYNITSPFFLYIGGYDERKNVTKLVNAFIAWKQKYPNNISLILAGNKFSTNKLYHSYDNIPEKYSSEIQKIGFVEDQDLPAIFQSALCFMNISQFEGFNIPLIEAAASSCPIITSNIDVHKEILGPNNALFVNPNDENEIVNAMDKISKNKKLREKLSKNALIKAKKYSWQKSAEETLEIYELTG
ncbi:MAG: Glycosyl transferase group 1 [Candidatus Peregrinibacteria bacterium GW2011_GWA2_33_10]|nr:MAG: Glycosyl transferase group 1 [Candidatus Peregrinibacteria bacterium GW2011_GWA2_33_10]